MREELTALIRQGRLPVGTQLRHEPRRAADVVRATVVEGGIRVERRTFTTPSAAAKSVTGKAVDGWKYWRLPDGERLDSLRPGSRRLD